MKSVYNLGGLSIFGGNLLPPKDNTYDLGSASRSWRQIHAQTAVYATSVTGNWSPSADQTYTLGTELMTWLSLFLTDTRIDASGNYVRFRNAGASAWNGVQFRNAQLQGTSDYPLDLSGATASVADIILTNSALIDNTTIGTLKLQTATTGYISISEGQTIVKGDYLDLDLDVALRFIGAGKNVDGALIFRDAITIGRDGAGVDFKVFGATANYYVFWEAATNALFFGADEKGIDVNFYGATASVALMWDASADALYSAGTIKIMASGDTDDYFTLATVSGIPTIYGTGAYLRIGDAAITSRSLVSEDDLMVTGNLEVDGTAYFDDEMRLASGKGLECTGYASSGLDLSATFIILKATQDIYLRPYSSTYHIICDRGNIRLTDELGIETGTADDDYFTFLAIDNDGAAGALLEVGRVVSADDPYFSMGGSQEFKFYNSGVADFDGIIQSKVAITIPAAAITGEEHGLAVSYTGTLSSGDSLVAGNFICTPEGTGGVWASGIYAKAVQGATKAVNGYLSGAEFEVVNAADNVSDWFPLILNANNSGAQMGTHASFIALRDYGSLELNSMLWFGDQSIGTKSNTVLLTTFADGAHISHAIKMRIGDTDYWLLVSNVLPSTT